MLKRNAIQCKKCGHVIESKHRHDFRWCPCMTVAVDGGLAYLRRAGNLDAYIELSERVDGPLVPGVDIPAHPDTERQ